MKNGHAKKAFLDWFEDDRLNARQRKEIERHLQSCRDCREYYRKMSRALSGEIDWSVFPRLEPDPFLPTRIRAAAEKTPGKRSWHWRSVVQWSFSTLMLVAGIIIGIYLGKGLAIQKQYSETDIVSAYYQAFAQQSYAENWEHVLEQQEDQQ